MKAVEIWDKRHGLFMQLDDILSSLPDRVMRSTWTLSDYLTPELGEEYLEVQNDRLEHIANTGMRVSGDDLMSVAKAGPGVIWATFRGYEPINAESHWIALHAIDSTFWRCETADIGSRQALMRTFKDVRLNP